MSNTAGGPGSGPEYLDGSSPVVAGASGGSGDSRKRLIAVGAIVAGGAVVAGGAWAATSFFATGAQPAEALPSSTVAYASVDLDPSGAQKIEAIKMLRKFPAFTDELDIQSDDDLLQKLFDEASSSGECEGLDYADDVKPWIGSRAAIAAVDLGEDTPAPVAVLQVTDAGQAEEGVQALIDACGTPALDGAAGEPDADATGGWVVEGDWLVLAETKEIADEVVEAAGSDNLADDADYGRWTEEAGDDGFMTMYVAKSAAQYFADAAGLGASLGGPLLGGSDAMGMTPDSECLDAATTAEEIDACFSATEDSSAGAEDAQVPEEIQQMVDDFDGMAATVRFDDGGMEIEYAVSDYQPDVTKLFATDTGASMVGDLPAGTVAAFGLGFEPGWVQGVVDYLKNAIPEDAASIDEGIAQLESETGLAFPEDLETLMGEGVTVSVGGGIDPDAVVNGGPGELPVGLTIKGDPAEIQSVIDKLTDQLGPEMAEFTQVSEGDGYAVLALQDDYRSALEKGGDLGSSEAYTSVVDGDAQTVFFVDFNADDDWLVRLVGDDATIADNLAPLAAVGATNWADGDVMHGQLKLTTD